MKQQTFEWSHIRSRRDHVDSHHDPRIHRVAEGLKEILWLTVARPIGDLGRELVPLTKDLSHCLDNVVGVGVVLGEDNVLAQSSDRETAR